MIRRRKAVRHLGYAWWYGCGWTWRGRFIEVLLRGYPWLQPGEETKLLRSRAGRGGSPPGRTGVHRPPANTRR